MTLFVIFAEATNLLDTHRNYDPVCQMYIFFPKLDPFRIQESSPLIVPQEPVQPIEIPLLEKIRVIKLNRKIFNLIQHTSHNFSITVEQVKIIQVLELLWPLLSTKNLIACKDPANNR